MSLSGLIRAQGDSTTRRRPTKTDAGGGEVNRTWGSATIPVRYHETSRDRIVRSYGEETKATLLAQVLLDADVLTGDGFAPLAGRYTGRFFFVEGTRERAALGSMEVALVETQERFGLP